MNSEVSAEGYISDAEIILEEARESLKKEHWHRVIRKSQEATELAIKGLFSFVGIDYPKIHILGRVLKKKISKFNLFNKEELERMAYISDSLGFERETSFYGSLDGIPARELYDKEDAEESLKNAEWLVKKIKLSIEKIKRD